MDQKIKTSLISESFITDFVTTMEGRGVNRETIQGMLLQVIDEVEKEVIEELMEKMSHDQRALLDALVSQDASGEEIAKQLDINPEELEELEAQKFEEVMKEFSTLLRSS